MYKKEYDFTHHRIDKDGVRKLLNGNPLLDDICDIIDDSTVTVVDTEDLILDDLEWEHDISLTLQEEDIPDPLADEKPGYEDGTYHYKFVVCDIYENGEVLFKDKSVVICYFDENDTECVHYIFDFCDHEYPDPEKVI